MYSLTAYRSILRSESYNEIYAWNQSCTRLPGSFMTFGASLVLAVTQKDTSKKSNARSFYYSRYEREDRCIIQRTHTERTGYRKRFLFLQTPLARESGGANLSCSYMNAMYIDRAIRRRLNEAENARDVH